MLQTRPAHQLHFQSDIRSIGGKPKGFKLRYYNACVNFGFGKETNDIQCTGNSNVNLAEVPYLEDIIHRIFQAGSLVTYRETPDCTAGSSPPPFQERKVLKFGQISSAHFLEVVHPAKYSSSTVGAPVHYEKKEKPLGKVYELKFADNFYAYVLAFPSGRVLIRDSDRSLITKDASDQTIQSQTFSHPPIISGNPVAAINIKPPTDSEVQMFRAKLLLEANRSAQDRRIKPNELFRDTLTESTLPVKITTLDKDIALNADKLKQLGHAEKGMLELIMCQPNLNVIFPAGCTALYGNEQKEQFDNVQVISSGSAPIENDRHVLDYLEINRESNPEKLIYRKGIPGRHHYKSNYAELCYFRVHEGDKTYFSYVLRFPENNMCLIRNVDEEIELPQPNRNHNDKPAPPFYTSGMVLKEELPLNHETLSLVFTVGSTVQYKQGPLSNYKDMVVTKHEKIKRRESWRDCFIEIKKEGADEQEMKRLGYRKESSSRHVDSFYVEEDLSKSGYDYILTFKNGKVLKLHSDKKIELSLDPQESLREDLVLNSANFKRIFKEEMPVFYRPVSDISNSLVKRRVKSCQITTLPGDLRGHTVMLKTINPKEKVDPAEICYGEIGRKGFKSRASEFYEMYQPDTKKYIYVLRLNDGSLLAMVSSEKASLQY